MFLEQIGKVLFDHIAKIVLFSKAKTAGQNAWINRNGSCTVTDDKPCSTKDKFENSNAQYRTSSRMSTFMQPMDWRSATSKKWMARAWP